MLDHLEASTKKPWTINMLNFEGCAEPFVIPCGSTVFLARVRTFGAAAGGLGWFQAGPCFPLWPNCPELLTVSGLQPCCISLYAVQNSAWRLSPIPWALGWLPHYLTAGTALGEWAREQVAQDPAWAQWEAGPDVSWGFKSLHILHCPIIFHLQNTNSKIKSLSISRWSWGGDMKPQVWSLSEEGDGGMRLHWSHAHEGGPVHIHSFNPLLQAWKALHWKPNITAGIWTWVVYFCS